MLTGLVDRWRRAVRWAWLQLGGAWFRIVAVGGPVVVVFLAIWPLSTVVVVLLVAALAPLLDRARRRRVGRKAPSPPTSPPTD